jgi:flagellar biogenesis protein FliO
MSSLTPVKAKLVGAAVLFGVFVAAHRVLRVGPTQVAQLLLVATLVLVGAVWMHRRRRVREAPRAPRLAVEASTALSARTQLALVEVEGRRFLIVHGERHSQMLEVLPELPLLDAFGRERTFGGGWADA